jgi:hypothetical protein
MRWSLMLDLSGDVLLKAVLKVFLNEMATQQNDAYYSNQSTTKTIVLPAVFDDFKAMNAISDFLWETTERPATEVGDGVLFFIGVLKSEIQKQAQTEAKTTSKKKAAPKARARKS